MIPLMQARPTGSWTQVFAGASMTFLVGSVAYVLCPLLGVAVWLLAAHTVVRKVRYGREQHTARAAWETHQAEWDARWDAIGGRLP